MISKSQSVERSNANEWENSLSSPEFLAWNARTVVYSSQFCINDREKHFPWYYCIPSSRYSKHRSSHCDPTWLWFPVSLESHFGVESGRTVMSNNMHLIKAFAFCGNAYSLLRIERQLIL